MCGIQRMARICSVYVCMCVCLLACTDCHLPGSGVPSPFPVSWWRFRYRLAWLLPLSPCASGVLPHCNFSTGSPVSRSSLKLKRHSSMQPLILYVASAHLPMVPLVASSHFTTLCICTLPCLGFGERCIHVRLHECASALRYTENHLHHHIKRCFSFTYISV